jgi:hypothetical protein
MPPGLNYSIGNAEMLAYVAPEAYPAISCMGYLVHVGSGIPSLSIV